MFIGGVRSVMRYEKGIPAIILIEGTHNETPI